MMEEMELERQKFLSEWDEESCAEWDRFLDQWHASLDRGNDENPDNRPTEF